MPVAIMPGSYDPPTIGHIDLIVRAAACFDQLVVAVGANMHKDPWFSGDQRAEFIREAVEDDPLAHRIRVVTYSGLLVDCAREVGATVVVKGVRDARDLGAETVQATYNLQLGGVETLFLPATAELSHISSSAIKELVSFSADPSPYVPAAVARALQSFPPERTSNA